ncbi:MAG: hydrogenase [Spirochaetes bacterium]|jgi:Ni,Fe-hydrogenase III large subunit|nr:hydrogenase [Spirochaetota bacterium]
MKWINTKNNRPVRIKDVPEMGMDELRSQIIRRCREGRRVVSFFGMPKGQSTAIYAVLADDDASRLYISSGLMGKDRRYQSITPEAPRFHIFERELFEDTGILPEGHPWLKGVRFGHDRADRESTMERYPFFTMKGEEVHEVAVGPVHAGVIEPGHFRFMCQGEDVHHLEIQLGYQHRGVEDLMIRNYRRSGIHLAESIAGDTVIGHATAYADAMEALAGTEISRRAQSVRAIALEMERAAIHIGDLGAIANDVAYLLGNAVFGVTRTLVINTLLALCGSRFGRGLVREGGVVFDFTPDLIKEFREKLNKVYRDTELMAEEMFESASVLSRLDNTGVVDAEAARNIGLVGPAGRASGFSLDVRADHPFGIYRFYPIHKRTMNSGDVFARAYMRYIEIKQSIDFILEQFESIADDRPLMQPLKKHVPDSLVVSMTEGWRGEIVHCAVTGKKGGIVKYKIKDPSLQNWYGLAYAVRNNGISDFPLCNKSFNLSYCGNDL